MKIFFLLLFFICLFNNTIIAENISSLEQVITLRVQIAVLQNKIEELEKRLIEGVIQRDKAINNAANSVDKRLESMNEFRSQLKDQSSTFVTKEYYDGAHKDLSGQIELLKLYQANQEGRMWMFGTAIGVFVTFIQVIIYFFTKKNKL